MGSMFSGNRLNKEDMEVVMKKAKKIVSEVVVFSKTYCGYCQRVKQLLTQLGATFKVLELDEMRVMDSNKQGKLLPILTEAGAIANNSSQL
ncbi:unnamed protein product [Eruca vesicaria subsp. sativa]|uniref:Glutaredoxin domain-containing protein n=1 Tax=Eruca vesicaria subsp. sativa TaxID=29727 RepID=A0ABC8J4B8_ERUVS|nr:unnamed protein product [Eruca vesicaria subsp. sativa]